jgi:hypothetical protein
MGDGQQRQMAHGIPGEQKKRRAEARRHQLPEGRDQKLDVKVKNS